MTQPYGGQPGQFPQGGNQFPPQGQPPGYSQQGYPVPQGPPVPPGYPQQQGYPIPPGAGRIVVDASYMGLSWLLSVTGPTITVDGRPMVARWGQTPLDLAPGQHHVKVHTRYLGEMGPAEAVIPVAAGQQVQVYYRAPAAMFIKGAIGPMPQKTPGVALVLGVMGGFLILMILMILLTSI